MKITELPITELRKALRATERVAGKDSPSAKVLRRELERRKALQTEQRQGASDAK